jgi:hypothetical protein
MRADALVAQARRIFRFRPSTLIRFEDLRPPTEPRRPRTRASRYRSAMRAERTPTTEEKGSPWHDEQIL